MQTIRSLFKTYRTGLVYAFMIVFGMNLALDELAMGNRDTFANYALVILALLIMELILGRLEHNRKHRQTKIPLADQFSRTSQFLHHLILPTVSYICILGFAYYNNQLRIRIPLLAVAFIVFTVLFVNIRAYYAHTINVLEHTHYIYDIIKLLIFFCASNFLLNLAISENRYSLAIVAVGALAIGLMLLMFARYHHLEIQALIMIALFGVMLSALLGGLISLGRFNVIQTSLIEFLGFYLSTAILHHQMDRSLTLRIAIEYAAVMALAIGILYGLS